MERTKKERSGGFVSALICALCVSALFTVLLIAAEAVLLTITPLTEKTMLILGYLIRAAAIACGAVIFAKRSGRTRGLLRALAVGGGYWLLMLGLCFCSGEPDVTAGKLALDACICVTAALAAGALAGKKNAD